MAETIRRYQPGDRDALFDICLRTADAGGDARGIYQDQELLPDIFAAPYVHLEPDLAFVLDDSGQAVGYVVGTSDTARFIKDLRRAWLPLVGDRHPAPAGDPVTPDEIMADFLHHPERLTVLPDHPAHLHIDLLPGYQGRGHGRALMNALFAGLRAAGAPRVYAAMVTTNVRARPFYDRLGFEVIPVPEAPNLTFLGRSTDEL